MLNDKMCHTAVLLLDLRSANTNSAGKHDVVKYRQLVPNFALCWNLNQNFEFFWCLKSLLPNLPSCQQGSVTWTRWVATGWLWTRWLREDTTPPIVASSHLPSQWAQESTALENLQMTLKTKPLCNSANLPIWYIFYLLINCKTFKDVEVLWTNNVFFSSKKIQLWTAFVWVLQPTMGWCCEERHRTFQS